MKKRIDDRPPALQELRIEKYIPRYRESPSEEDASKDSCERGVLIIDMTSWEELDEEGTDSG